MKKVITNIVLILSGLLANAQQVGMFGHYFYKPMIYNPAFTGSDDGTSLMLVHHNQWTGFKGAPQFNLFTADKNVMNRKLGIGLGLISDKRGIYKRAGGDMFYSYRINMEGGNYLSLGLSLGIFNQALDFSKSVVENTADPNVFIDSQNEIGYDGNAGLAFNFKGLEFGAAVPHLFGNKISYDGNANESGNAFYTQARHYMVSLKYPFFISKEKGTSIKTLGLIRSVANAPLQYDINAMFDSKDKFWAGMTYKSNYAIAFNAGFSILKQFSVGYSYDIITGSIGNYSGMSHEIMLSYKFKEKKITESKTEKTKEEPIAKEPEPVLPAKDTVKAVEPVPVEPDKPKPVPVESEKPKPVPVEPEKPKPTPVEPEKSKPAVETKPFDYDAYQKHKLDSLNKLKSAEPGTDKDVWIGTYQALDYKDEKGQTPNKGYYVVVGSFLNRDYAIAEVKRMTDKGFKATNWVYSDTRKFNYVFISRGSTEKEAVKQAAKILGREAEFEDVWILHLTE